MAVELNHTIVPAHDPQASAQFLAGILGLEVGPPVAHFTPVTLSNGVTLDFDAYDNVDEHHYAFLASEDEFEAAFGRIRQAGISYYADPLLPTSRPDLHRQGRQPRHVFPRPQRPPHGDPHPALKGNRPERRRPDNSVMGVLSGIIPPGG